MAVTEVCPGCGGPLVPVDTYKTETTRRIEMRFPTSPVIRLFEEVHAVLICPNPSCLDFARQRVFR